MGSPVSAVIANLYMKSFEEQAITTSSYKPTIWKRYVDDTFTILDRGNVDDFLQHLNNQQPSIRFTMETENNNKLAFLDIAVSREPDGRLTTSVYRKPTHTDQYLVYDSHHPQSVKRGIVKCLYERAKRLVTKPSVISEKKKHLSSVLVSNGYPFSFSQKTHQDQKTKQQCRTRHRVQNYCGFTLCQRSLRTTSPFPTTTRRCFQVGDYAKIPPSTTKRRCRPS